MSRLLNPVRLRLAQPATHADVTVAELARAFALLDSKAQVEFLVEVTRIAAAEFNTELPDMQWHAVGSALAAAHGPQRDRVVDMLRDICGSATETPEAES